MRAKLFENRQDSIYQIVGKRRTEGETIRSIEGVVFN